MDSDESQSWRTAGVLDRTVAKRFIGRLASCDIDHAVANDGGDLRVTVRRQDLPAALALRPDDQAVDVTPRDSPDHYQMYLRLLCSIPLGAFAGTVLLYFLPFPLPLLPAITCLAFVFTVEAIADRMSKPRAGDHESSRAW